MAQYSVSIVNYLNSAPFVHGLSLEHDLSIEVVLDHPAAVYGGGPDNPDDDDSLAAILSRAASTFSTAHT